MTIDGSTNLNFGPWDKHDGYSMGGNIVIGCLQILWGLFTIALGIGAICTWASGYYIGYGIWIGFMVTISGGICIGAAISKSTCMIMTNLTFSLIAAVLGCIQLSLGIVATTNDATQGREGIVNGIVYPSYAPWGIYFNQNNANNWLCAGEQNHTGWSAWGPVDILLLLIGFFEAVLGTVAAILCCQVVCCGYRRVSSSNTGVYYRGNAGTGTIA